MRQTAVGHVALRLVRCTTMLDMRNRLFEPSRCIRKSSSFGTHIATRHLQDTPRTDLSHGDIDILAQRFLPSPTSDHQGADRFRCRSNWLFAPGRGSTGAYSAVVPRLPARGRRENPPPSRPSARLISGFRALQSCRGRVRSDRRRRAQARFGSEIRQLACRSFPNADCGSHSEAEAETCIEVQRLGMAPDTCNSRNLNHG